VSRSGPVRVDVVGAIPTVYNMCAPCCTTDELGVCGIDLRSEQLKEYPPHVVENNARAAVLIAQLLHDYGDRVRPSLVDLASPRGVWLALRHRVGSSLVVVVDGKVLPPEVDAVRAAVAAVSAN
jgi:hypothetical protein